MNGFGSLTSGLVTRIRDARAGALWWGLVVVLLVTGAIVKLVFAAQFSGAEIRNDHFRHIALVIMPLLETGDLRLLWANAHPSALIHIYEMIILFALDGNFRWEAYSGVLASVASFAVMIGLTRADARREDAAGPASLAALAILLPWVGILSDAPFRWTLIYMQSSFILVGTLYALYAVRACDTMRIDLRRPANWVPLAKLYGLGLVALMVHADFSLLFIAGLFGIFLIPALVRRDWDRLSVCLVMLALVVTRFVVFGSESRSQDQGLLAFLVTSIPDIPGYLEVFGRSLAGGMLGTWASTLPEGQPVLAAACRVAWFTLTLGYAAAMVRAALSERWLRVAGVLMAFGALFALAAVLGRSQGDYPWGIFAPRYFLVYNIAAAAFLWVVADALGAWLSRHSRSVLLLTGVRVAVLAALIPVSWLPTADVWGAGAFRRMVAAQRELAVYMVAEDPDNRFAITGFVTGANPPGVYEPVIDWLRDHETGVFSSGYPASRSLSDYRRARAAWSEGQPASLVPDDVSGTCFFFEPSGTARAYRLDVVSDQRHPAGLRFVDMDRGEAVDVRFILPGEMAHYGVLPPGDAVRLCWQREIGLQTFSAVPLDAE